MERISKSDDDSQRPREEISSNSRRGFLGKMGMAAVAAGVLGKTPVAFAQSGRRSGSAIANIGVSPTFSGREQYALRLRIATAQKTFTFSFPHIQQTATSSSIPTTPRAIAKACCRTLLEWSTRRPGRPLRRHYRPARIVTSRPSSLAARRH